MTGTRSGWPLMAVAVVLTACSSASDVEAPRQSLSTRLSTRLEVSSTTARPGTRIAVRIYQHNTLQVPLLGMQGTFRFDPNRLAYVGQPLAGETIELVNDEGASRGRLRMITIDRTRLPDEIAELVFEVRTANYTKGLTYHMEEAATRDLQVLHTAIVEPGPVPLTRPPSTIPPRRLTARDWLAHLQSGVVFDVGTLSGGARYGDVTLDGRINVADVASTSNVAIGLRPLLTDSTKDLAIAANVFPFNLPGLGEADDPVPPGRDADGSYNITISDVVVISNESVGYDPPVAGELIPGRTISSDRSILAGTIPVSRTLFRDTVYELRGTVNVPGGVTLTIQAGTRLEGDPASRGMLVVRRGGNIDARGTRLQPIVFTCAAVVKSRGCWGGVIINGFSLLNNGQVLPGGVDVNGCPQKEDEPTEGFYGGCLIQDTSGVLRYVRVEYAGMAAPDGGVVPGLQLRGVGSGTRLDSIQVFASLGDGLYVAGGTANIRNVVLTDNAGDGLRWIDGWVGKGQFLIVQQTADNDDALAGENFALNPNAAPRSAPQLYNVTVIGPPAGSGAIGRGVLLDHGSGLILRNAVLLRPGGAGLDIQGTESCTLTSGVDPVIRVESSIFFLGNPNYAADADCVDESAYASAPDRANRIIDPGLAAPFVTVTADLRPLPGAAALAGAVAVPNDGFFDPSATYVGAVPAANATGSNIPWYAGWTQPGSGLVLHP